MPSRARLWEIVTDPRFVWGMWIVYAAAAAAVRLSHPANNSVVYYVYLSGGMRFVAGEELYDGTGNNFVYPPTAALPFLPLSYLPYVLGGAIWRMTNLLVFGWGAIRLARTTEGPRGTLLITSFLTMLLSWSAARHGQMTLIMAGFMMLGVAQLHATHWWRSAASLAVSMALKQLSIPLLLVAGFVHRELRGRLLLCVVLAFLSPFLFQSWSYVASQYEGVPEMMRLLAERNSRDRTVFVHLFSLLETCGLSLGDQAQLVVRALLALVTLAVCVVARKRGASCEWAFYLYSFVICYALLMNPVAERNTYAIMTPALGIAVAHTTLGGRHNAAIVLWGLVTLFLVSHTLTRALPGTPLSLTKPIACLAFAGLVAWHLFRRRKLSGNDHRPLSGP